MASYQNEIQVRWADLDPNFHVRHSVYYDWGAQCRMNFLLENGITPAKLTELHIGPILFREECVFRKEIKFGDKLTIDVQISKAKKDFSRWTIRHQIKKEGLLCAVLTVEIAWMDIVKRKLTALPEDIIMLLKENMPLAEDMEWLGD